LDQQSQQGPLERVQAPATIRWSGTSGEVDIENLVLRHSITVSDKKLRRGGETDLFLDGFLSECLPVAASA
jgi:hypothetical protein